MCPVFSMPIEVLTNSPKFSPNSSESLFLFYNDSINDLSNNSKITLRVSDSVKCESATSLPTLLSMNELGTSGISRFFLEDKSLTFLMQKVSCPYALA